MYRVLIVEDDEPTRNRLARAVSDDDRLALVGSGGSVSDGLHLLSAHQPTILLTDLGLPDGSGIDLIRYAKASNRGTQAMVVTIFGALSDPGGVPVTLAAAMTTLPVSARPWRTA